ncbi:MAG: hypothetical protein KGM99_19275, partial [Burkholderiales bacterium]|nr:hypothetical protein [Burkholderiales bacterium]
GASAQIATASQAQSMPPNLAPQVQKLADLLSDRFAQAYPEATMVQTIPLGAGENIMLVVLTVEGFSGGNNYTQYLAVFKPEAGEKQATHYQLIDTLPVAGKSWRTIEHLQAHAYRHPKTGDLDLDITAQRVPAGDTSNAQTTTIHLLLHNGRLFEKSAASPARTKN